MGWAVGNVDSSGKPTTHMADSMGTLRVQVEEQTPLSPAAYFIFTSC